MSTPQPAEQVLNIAQVMSMTGLGRTTIYEKARSGAFPQARQLGAKRVGWLQSEVAEWLRQLPVAGRVDPTIEKMRQGRAAARGRR